MSADGYNETILLDCNRRSSDEYLADPYSSEKSIFSNKVGDGLQLNIGDKVALHSAYVSGRGVGGDVIELKGDFFDKDTYQLPFTNVKSIISDISASMGFGKDRDTVTDISASYKTYSLLDNEVNVSVGFYTNVNGENYFHCPRRFDKHYPESLLTSSTEDQNWTWEYKTCYNQNGTTSTSASTTYQTIDTGSPYLTQGSIPNPQETGLNPSPPPTFLYDARPLQRNGGESFTDVRPPVAGLQWYPESYGDVQPSPQGNLMVAQSDWDVVKHDTRNRINGLATNNASFGVPPPIINASCQQWMNGSRISRYSELRPANDNSRYTIMVRGGNGSATTGEADPTDTCRSVFDKRNASHLQSPNSYIQNSSLTFGSANVRSPPWLAKYIDYREILNFSVEAGYDSPANIATTMTNQIQKVGQPEAIGLNLAPRPPTNASGNPLVSQTLMTIKNESPAFKLFRAGNPMTFNASSYTSFQNASMPALNGQTPDYTAGANASQHLYNYMNAFTYIGVKRPDLFKLRRDLHGEYLLNASERSSLGSTVNPMGNTQYRLGGMNSWKTLTSQADGLEHGSLGNIANGLLITDRLWEGETIPAGDFAVLHGDALLQRISKLFKAQGKYPELFNYPNYSPPQQADISVDYCRFLHLASRVYGTDSDYGSPILPGEGAAQGTGIANEPLNPTVGLDGNYYDQLGCDYWSETSGEGADKYDTNGVGGWHNLFTQYNYAMSNPLWIYYDPSLKDTPGFGNDRTEGSDLGYGFAVKYLHTDGKYYIGFMLGTDTKPALNRSFAQYGPMNNTQTLANASYVVSAGVRCGWDYHSNAYGCPIVGLYTGQMTHGFEASTYNAETTAMMNACYTDVISTGYQNEIYLGAIEPLINFDSSSNRFSISDLHTPEFVSQPFNSGANAGAPIVDDAGKKCYKINKRLNHYTFCPDMIPYKDKQPFFDATVVSASLVRPNINLKSYTIFDSHSGISLEDFGIPRSQWLKSLWNTLGFTFDQMNASENNLQFRNNDIVKPNMMGMTTNAKVLQNDIMNYSVNLFGAVMYQPNVPMTSTEGSTVPTTTQKKQTPPAIVVADIVSTKIIAENLPTKSTRPYYLVKSNLLPNQNYMGGRSDLPVMAVVTKINGYQDAFSQDGTQMEFVVTRPMVVNNIKTMITDPDGTPARVDDSSGVIYKVTKQINAQMNLVDEYLQQQDMKEKQRQKADEEFIQVLQQGGQYSAFQDLEERLKVAQNVPVPSGLFADPIAQNIAGLESGQIARFALSLLGNPTTTESIGTGGGGVQSESIGTNTRHPSRDLVAPGALPDVPESNPQTGFLRSREIQADDALFQESRPNQADFETADDLRFQDVVEPPTPRPRPAYPTEAVAGLREIISRPSPASQSQLSFGGRTESIQAERKPVKQLSFGGRTATIQAERHQARPSPTAGLVDTERERIRVSREAQRQETLRQERPPLFRDPGHDRRATETGRRRTVGLGGEGGGGEVQPTRARPETIAQRAHTLPAAGTIAGRREQSAAATTVSDPSSRGLPRPE